ncbi:unnamed protein product [Anisakis simplex]|uniref:Uncharacterized protein n=1 Tax=Anisakis simplex TaxID=6269 RepID=A0A0M3J4W1_ANISI|nr:unnamed protein product [Anisakis simplex]
MVMKRLQEEPGTHRNDCKVVARPMETPLDQEEYREDLVDYSNHCWLDWLGSNVVAVEMVQIAYDHIEANSNMEYTEDYKLVKRYLSNTVGSKLKFVVNTSVRSE